MAAFINTNLASLNSQRNLNTSQSQLTTSLQRLSSGLRINSAKDDAAGLAISDRMTSQIRGLNQGIRNANDGISLAQTAEGALATMTDMLQRMRELAVQGANATAGSTDLTNMDAEYQTLKTEITRIGTSTTFNGKAIIGAAGANGSGAQAFQVGANAGDTITVTTVDAAGYTSGLTANLDTNANASLAIATIDTALLAVSTDRGTYGAAQNTMQFAVQNLQNASENQSAARSRIMDTDFASETAQLTRGQILQQAGTAMLAQANSLPNGVLALLRG
jgi:flagellin